MNDKPFFFRVDYEKTEESVFIPHIYFTYIIARILRKNGVMLDYSKGFNPRPKTRFIFPLSVGVSGENEMFFFYSFNDDFSEEGIKDSLPAGVRIKRIYKFDNTKYSESNIFSGIFEFKLKNAYNYDLSEKPDEVDILDSNKKTCKIKFYYKRKAKFWDIMKYFSGSERFENIDYIRRKELCEN